MAEQQTLENEQQTLEKWFQKFLLFQDVRESREKQLFFNEIGMGPVRFKGIISAFNALVENEAHASTHRQRLLIQEARDSYLTWMIGERIPNPLPPAA